MTCLIRWIWRPPEAQARADTVENKQRPKSQRKVHGPPVAVQMDRTDTAEKKTTVAGKRYQDMSKLELMTLASETQQRVGELEKLALHMQTVLRQ